MNLQQQVNANNTAPQPAAQNKPEVIGLENIDLKDAPKIDLKDLEPGQGGYDFIWLGAVKFDGQWGPYYLVGVQDQNGNVFKFFSNKQITQMIDNQESPFDKVGNRFFIESKLKPGMKYKTKSGEEREARGYWYEIRVIE